ncbi:DUF397 domain-containing protein [Streptomyces albus]|uniref:DUF397 domain-containing protein n=1 Tax=Streptomyces albus TaxID=1888 RepID=UPI0033F95F07
MTTTDKGEKVNSGPNWRTSTYTGTENCVEVADGDPTEVLVRDTKNRGGPVLRLSPAAWADFVRFATNGPGGRYPLHIAEPGLENVTGPAISRSSRS